MIQSEQIVRVFKKSVEDCEMVIVDGVKYRDVTQLLYEESMYEKYHPTDEDTEKLKKYKERKKTKRDGEWKILERDKILNPPESGVGRKNAYTAKEVQLIIKLKDEGKDSKAINRTVGAVQVQLSRMRRVGLVE